MQHLNLKPSHKPVKDYYAALGQFGQLNIDHEMAVRSAFGNLLDKCARQFEWTLVPEYSIERPKAMPLRVDGALLDAFRLRRGLWEAKDERDDLEKEAKRKIAAGYPTDNIIFQAPERAILFQNGVRQGLNEDISSPDNLVELLRQFFQYPVPHHEEWEAAVEDFSARLPEIAGAAKELIEKERQKNPAFVRSFDAFYALCQQAINPNLSVEAVENMLIQHLLTERIFRKIFDNPDFTRRNVIAVEIEKVIASLTSRAFNRDAFLHDLDRFYKAIEVNAQDTSGYSEKQAFLNTVYERFFQGYSPKEADTHGIVYTPQPIVNFIVRSVEEILQKEFGRSLSDRDVHILDPFVGTGNFITRVMQEIKTSALPYKYENELHCNEVMLLPYYIASMNIEHAYLDRTDEYKPFPGICLVDTFELAEPEQGGLEFMTEENTERVKRQKKAPIFVIIGNPPYNAWQVNENDNNRNRHYPVVDKWIANTYARDSAARLRNSLNDPYIKAIRWAANRVDEGVVAFVSNNAFMDSLACDGMRKHLAQDFTKILHVNLKGNARTSGDRRRREAGNVFDDAIRVGIGITFFVKKKKAVEPAEILAFNIRDFAKSEEKKEFLESVESIDGIVFHHLRPATDNSWIEPEHVTAWYTNLLPLGTSVRKGSADLTGVVFAAYSGAVCTNGDAYVYNFNRDGLTQQAKELVEDFNTQFDHWKRKGRPTDLSKVIKVDERKNKWIRNTRRTLLRGEDVAFIPSRLREALYRPFSTQWYFFDRAFNEDLYWFPRIFPNEEAEEENRIISVTGPGSEKPFVAITGSKIADMHLSGAACRTQCFPFYVYSEDGSNRRENITDWALEQFRSHYGDRTITKWDIFHYVYALLHHPQYRQRYAANLKRELPRIPFVGVNGIVLPDNVILSEGAAHQSAPESKDPAFVQTVDDAPGSSARGPSTRPSSLRSGGLARDDRTSGVESAGEGARATKFKTDMDVFRAFVKAGERLADLHVNYEQQPEYPLQKIEKAGEKLDWCVEKMRLSRDKASIVYNQLLTLSGIRRRPSNTVWATAPPWTG